MKVQIIDWNGMGYQIDSLNPVLVGAWFSDTVCNLVSNNYALASSVRIIVLPTTPEEYQLLRTKSLDTRLTAESLITLYEGIKKAAECLLQKDIEADGPA